jgi:hypothetical protein
MAGLTTPSGSRSGFAPLRFLVGVVLVTVVVLLGSLVRYTTARKQAKQNQAFEQFLQSFGDATLKRLASTAKSIVIKAGKEISPNTIPASMPSPLKSQPSGKLLFIWTQVPEGIWDKPRWGAHLLDVSNQRGLLLAERPDEVETVVLIERERKPVNYYFEKSTGKATNVKAFACYYYAYVVSLKAETVVGCTKIANPENNAPEEKTDRQDVECSDPDRRLLYDWLRGVQRTFP